MKNENVIEAVAKLKPEGKRRSWHLTDDEAKAAIQGYPPWSGDGTGQ